MTIQRFGFPSGRRAMGNSTLPKREAGEPASREGDDLRFSRASGLEVGGKLKVSWWLGFAFYMVAFCGFGG